jgi:hypothetical protein
MIFDRYYGVEYYGALQFYAIPATVTPFEILPFSSISIELRTSQDGLKKSWVYTQEIDNPIESVTFELTEKGCGILKMVFSELSTPIEASEIIRVYMRNVLIYEGIVDNDVDMSAPVVVAAPFWKRLEEVFYTGTFSTSETPEDILQTVIGAVESETGVSWNSVKVDFGAYTPVVAVAYVDTPVKDIIDSMITMSGSTLYWGVDVDRDFYVKTYDSTAPVIHYFYAKDNADFEKVSITEDYGKIGMTEAVVYKKVSGGGEAEKVGTVGDFGNATYPPLDIASKIRTKKGKFTASEYVSDTTALVWAYEELKKQADKALTVKVSGIVTDVILPLPGNKILAEDDFKKSMVVAIDCESATGWTNAALDATGKGKDGNKSIKLFTAASDSTFDFGRNVSWYKQKRVGFYITAPAGTVLQVQFIGTVTSSFNFGIVDNNLLSYYDFDVKHTFRYVKFIYVSGNIYVDDIQVFCETKRQEIVVVKKSTIKITDKGIFCDVEGGDPTNLESNQLQELNRKIKILEAVNNI